MLYEISRIIALFTDCHANALEKGWWDNERAIALEGDQGLDADLVWIGVPTKIALVHSEISEALEDLRVGKIVTTLTESGKPVGALSELADVAIRLGDLCGALDLIPLVFSGDGHDRDVVLTAVMFPEPASRLALIHEAASGIMAAWRVERKPVGRPAPAARLMLANRVLLVLGHLNRLAADLGGNLHDEMVIKMGYNRGRAYRHGGKLL